MLGTGKMTKEQIELIKNKLAEHNDDIESLGLTGCQVLWSLKNGDGKIAAYSVLVLVPEREDDTTKAVCEKLDKKIQFQVERDIEQESAKPSDYYTYLQDLELECEMLSEKVMNRRMEEIYATFVRDRDAPLPHEPPRSCPKIVKTDKDVSHS